MALVVGTDSYVTIEEANTYIANHYVSTNAQRIAWVALSDADKEIYLRNSIVELERLQYRGQRYQWATVQPLAFPRVYIGQEIERLFSDNYYYHNNNFLINQTTPTVPNEIKNAQIEEALELASPTTDSEIAETYSGNIKSYSIGHLSETYATGDRNSLQSIIKSSKAQQLLRKYTNGGYHVQ
jgi:hypothetical protein